MDDKPWPRTMVAAVALGWFQTAILALVAIVSLVVSLADPEPGLTGELGHVLAQMAAATFGLLALVFGTCAFLVHRRHTSGRVAYAFAIGVLVGLAIMWLGVSTPGFWLVAAAFSPALLAVVLTLVPSSRPFFAHSTDTPATDPDPDPED